MYGNETEVGQALRDSGVPREDVFVTTKLPPERAGREQDTLAKSLRALGVSSIDLWLIHWPPAAGSSVRVWREFIAARDAGLTRSIGVSNYSTAQIDELISATGETPVANQIPWSPSGLLGEAAWPSSRERGVVIEGYSPLKGSNLRDPGAAGDRHAARRHPGAGGAALAHRPRRPGDPEVGAQGAHRSQLRSVRVPARPRRSDAVGFPVDALIASGAEPRDGTGYHSSLT